MNSTEIAELEELYILKCESLENVERIKNLQYHMILDLAERVQALHKRNPNHSQLVKNITNYIKENLTERITVSEIAEYLSKSRGYVTTEFKKITGMNLSDYISELKINEAKELIRYTDRSFIDISSYLGFRRKVILSRYLKRSLEKHQEHIENWQTWMKKKNSSKFGLQIYHFQDKYAIQGLFLLLK